MRQHFDSNTAELSDRGCLHLFLYREHECALAYGSGNGVTFSGKFRVEVILVDQVPSQETIIFSHQIVFP